MKVKTIAIAVLIIVAAASCEKKSEITELTLEVSKVKVLNDSKDAVYIIVTDQNDRDVTAKVSLNFADDLLAGYEVKYGTAGTFDLYAEFEGIKSNVIQITVVEDLGLEYERNVLIEQFTATWCPWCPAAISQISDLSLVNGNIDHIAHHLDDEFSFSLSRDLFQDFGFGGIPAMMANRTIVWSGLSSDINELQTPSRVGLEVEVGGTLDNVTVDVSVTFGKVFANDINLCVYLIEDGLIADQSSNFDEDPNSPWYQMGVIIEDLVHEGVMIRTGSELYGDIIPSESIDIGSVYEKQFTIAEPNVSVGTPWINDLNNASAVVAVSFGSGERTFQIINSVTCGYGSVAENDLESSK